jgi:Immunity protein 26
MAKRQRVTEGAILEINIENQYYTYAQILTESDCAFFDFKSTEQLKDFSILEKSNILFIVAVYSYIINQGMWIKVGKIDIRNDLKVKPMKFIQDALNPTKFRLYNPNSGEMIPATKDECKGLEVAAVYRAEHIELRISDYYAGRVNLDRQKDLDIFN